MFIPIFVEGRRAPGRNEADTWQKELSLAVSTDYERFLRERFDFLAPQLDNVDRIAQTGELPDASIAASARVVSSCSPYGGSANNQA